MERGKAIAMELCSLQACYYGLSRTSPNPHDISERKGSSPPNGRAIPARVHHSAEPDQEVI